jgi:hypothetical protein
MVGPGPRSPGRATQVQAGHSARVDGATVALVATTVQIRYLPCRVLVASLTG